MNIIIISSLIILLIYLIFTAVKYGVGDYVSDNFYISKNKWIFSSVMAFTAVSLIVPMIEKNENIGFLAFICAFALLLVSAEPHYKTYGRTIHNAGAYTALLSGLIWVSYFHPLWVVGITSLFTCYCLTIKKKKYYIGEVLTFALIYLTLLLG